MLCVYACPPNAHTDSFCLSLQLELLSSQTAQMVRGPWQEALWPVYTKDLSLSLFFWTYVATRHGQMSVLCCVCVVLCVLLGVVLCIGY